MKSIRCFKEIIRAIIEKKVSLDNRLKFIEKKKKKRAASFDRKHSSKLVFLRTFSCARLTSRRSENLV